LNEIIRVSYASTWRAPSGPVEIVGAQLTPHQELVVPALAREAGVAARRLRAWRGQSDQKAADYLKINPTARIPTLIDPGGPGGKPLTVTQSWAILMYLCERPVCEPAFLLPGGDARDIGLGPQRVAEAPA